MKTSRILFLASVLSFGILSGCDYVKGDKVDPTGFSGSSNKALIEDFTGHRCGNCPRAHEEGARLEETFGENVVIVAVHAGGFAAVIPALGYSADYKTQLGTDLDAYFQANALTGLPIGLVNRRSWNGGPLTPYTVWSSNVSTVLNEPSKLAIDLTTAYDGTSGNLTVDADLEYYTTGDANHQILIVITEDSIISKQEDYTQGEHEDYVHNHVLRGVVSTGGSWGTPVKGNTIVLGEKIHHEFTIQMDPAWVPKNCHAVAIVHDNSTKEVLQVEKASILE